MTTNPLVGAVHDHHTDFSLRTRPGPEPLGSPASRVAPVFEPPTEILVPAKTIRSAKLSLAGCAKAVQPPVNRQSRKSRRRPSNRPMNLSLTIRTTSSVEVSQKPTL